MRYWWVNQNQTFQHEFAGSYLWSPKRNANGARNPFYESMREAAPGDLVFCFVDTWIKAFGVVQSFAYECPKPAEFGETGRNWETIGWRVDVRYQSLSHPMRPMDWMEVLRPLLPARYSPLQANGRGLQGVYLTELSRTLALSIANLIDSEVSALARSGKWQESPLIVPTPELTLWEEHLRKTIEQDSTIPETTRQALVIARRGQGLFREKVQDREPRCRITLVDQPEHLRASHLKPWRDSTNAERLDGENGLMLTPSIDHLLDRGFIAFESDGRVLISPVADKPSLEKMGVHTHRPVNVGTFTAQQARYLEYHRDLVFLRRSAS